MQSTTIALTGLGDGSTTHGRGDGEQMHPTPDGFIGWIGHGSWIRYERVDLHKGIAGAELTYSSGWSPEPRTVEIWVAPTGSARPDNGELVALIHADRSTGSYAAASAVRAKALSVSPAHGGIHDVYVLFRGHELNFGGLELTLRLAEQPPPKPAHDGVPPVQPHTTAPKTQTPKSRTREIRLRLVQGEQVYPQIAWPDNPRAEVRWASSRKSVASVTNEGKITALSPGSTDVTVKSQASLATFHVTVIAKRGR